VGFRCRVRRAREGEGGEVTTGIERIDAKINKTPSCWEWTGYMAHGYGYIRIDGRLRRAHRVVYEAMRGQIPAGLVIDHLCKNKACVNPDHLEPVTQGENVRRGLSSVKGRIYKTRCKNGHPYNEDNTHISATGKRRCIACHKVYRDKHRAKRRTWKHLTD
jgi:hypothetical protein